MTPTKAQLKVLTDLGITTDDVEKAQARQVRAEKRSAIDNVFDLHEEALTAFLAEALEVQPISPSTKEGSTWVGAVLTGSVAGYSFKVTVTDTNAVDAAKAAQKAAKSA